MLKALRAFFVIIVMLVSAVPLCYAQTTELSDCDTMNLAQLSNAARNKFLSNDREKAFNLFICAFERFSQEDWGVKEFLVFHNALASTLRAVGANGLCVKHAQKAFQISKSYHKGRVGMMRAATIYGNHLLLSGYADSAIVYYRMACWEKKKILKKPDFQSEFNNLGMAFAGTGNYDSALVYYRKALQYADINKPNVKVSGLVLSTFDNLVRCQWKAGTIAASSEILDSLLVLCEQHGNLNRRAKCFVLLAEIYNDLGDYEASGGYIQRLLTLQGDFGNSIEQASNLHSDKIVLAHAKGVRDWTTIEKYSQQIIRKTDSLESLNKAFLELLITAQPYYDAALINVETRLAQVERDKDDGLMKQLSLTRWLRTVIGLAVLVLLSIVVILYVFKKRQQAFIRERSAIRKRIEGKQQRLEVLEEEIRIRKRDIEKFTLYLSSMKTSRNTLRQVLERSMKQKGDDSKRTIKRLLIDNKSRDQIVHRSDVLFEHVEAVSEAFYERLKRQFPTLSPSEVELCAFIRAGLSNIEIAHIRNIQPKSVRMTKYRLKKKLAIAEESDITDFVKTI